MKRLTVIFALIRWLYFEPHSNGVKHTINTRNDGQTWFLVEPSLIWIDADQTSDVVEIGGQSYVRIGGEQKQGQYLLFKDVESLLFPTDDTFPHGDNNDL